MRVSAGQRADIHSPERRRNPWNQHCIPYHHRCQRLSSSCHDIRQMLSLWACS